MILVLGAALMLTGPAAEPTIRVAMPADVAAHYRDYNFVNAFSTQAERQVLAQSTTVPADGRLAQVARALARLAGQTDEVDPGIVLREHSRGGGRRHEGEFRSDIVRVTGWRPHETHQGEAWVDLEVLVVEQGTIGLFVANYDRLTQRGKSIPEVDALLAMIRRLPLRSVERHRWFHTGDEWRRAPAVLIFTSP